MFACVCTLITDKHLSSSFGINKDECVPNVRKVARVAYDGDMMYVVMSYD